MKRFQICFYPLLGFSSLVVYCMSPTLLRGQAQQPATQTGASKASTPDLSGIWARPEARGPRAGYENPGFSITRESPSMTPWAEAKWKAVRVGPKRNEFDRGNENWDPSDIHCLPWGPTRPYTKVDQKFEILQHPTTVYILFETNRESRRVYVDGRGHPEDWPFRWMGHSIGKYEGDTLVIDTTGLNDLTWIDTMGHPHSDALHIVERIRRVAQDTLQIDFWFDDPKAYTKPWTGKRVFALQTGRDAEMFEYIACEDHMMQYHVPRLLRGEDLGGSQLHLEEK